MHQLLQINQLLKIKQLLKINQLLKRKDGCQLQCQTGYTLERRLTIYIK